jgi:SAM-dependent methyltransferase
VTVQPDPSSGAAAAWDVEYVSGRYRGEPPLPFVADILVAARGQGLLGRDGLYVGCGNGRNYLPLVAGGLDLVGLDVSATALAQLATKAPQRRARLVQGNLGALPAEATFPIVIGIQVFQHGDRATAHAHVRAAQRRLAAGGLFCVRVNAVGTDFEYEHDLTESDDDGGFSVRYRGGPKAGLEVHFFAEVELSELFEGYVPIVGLRLVRTWRVPAERGQWSQWEAIWCKPD